MVASNNVRWVGNLNGFKEPLIKRGLFQAGTTQKIKRGEMIERTALAGTAWVPWDSDFAAAGELAIAWEEIKDGDRAGWYSLCIPRDGDLFAFDIAAAAAVKLGDPLYFSSSEKFATAGANIVANVAGEDNYPDFQGHLSDDGSGDAGTTVKSVTRVVLTIKKAASYYAKIQT